MSDEKETAGTSNQDGGDAGDSSTAGTPGENGRNAQDSENIARLNLEWKIKAERANELEREVAELRAQQAQSPAAQSQGSGEDQIQQLVAQAQDFQRKGDPVAALTLMHEARLAQLAQDTQFALQIRDLPLEERQEVYNHFQKNRHRFGDPAAARAEIQAGKYAEENKRLREELAKASSRKPDPDVVRTEGRDVPASEHKKRTMTVAEFDHRQAQLKAENRFRLAMDEQMAVRKGDIELSN